MASPRILAADTPDTARLLAEAKANLMLAAEAVLAERKGLHPRRVRTLCHQAIANVDAALREVAR